MLSNKKNISRDGLKEIQRQHDTNIDAAEQKYSGNIVIITRK